MLISRLTYAALTLAAYASSSALLHSPARLASGGRLAFAVRESIPLDSDEWFQSSTSGHPPLPGFPGATRPYLCESFPTCLDPYPGGSCGAHTRFFPQDFGLPDVRTRSSASQYPYSNFRMGFFSRLQSFPNVQARRFARHPDCSYRSASTLGSHGFYVRAYHGSLPPRAPDRLTVRFGQLTVRGLSPLKIRSLVGCSPNAEVKPVACLRHSAPAGGRLEPIVRH